MSSEIPYDERFPIGIQTVVKDRVLIQGGQTYQVNTRTAEGWWMSKTTPPSHVRQELVKHAARFENTYGKTVDTRYVKKYLI